MSEIIDIFSVTGGFFAKALKKLTLEMRVVASVRRQMSRADLRINSRRLRQLIYGPGFAARLAQSRGPDDSLIDDLADVLVGTKRGDGEGALVLRASLLKALRTRLAGSTPSSDFKDDRDEARTVEIIRAVENQSTDEIQFEHRLSGMHPIRAQDFRELRHEWPGAARWLGTISATQDRLGLLKRWSTNPPTFVDAPPRIFGILADLAIDLPMSGEAGEISERFIEHGLKHGLEPKGYWAVRLLTAKKLFDLPSATAFLADFRGYPLVEASLHPDGADGAISMLENWTAPTDREELQRALLLAEYYLHSLKLDEAIALGRATYERFRSTASAMHAARALTIRHMMNASVINKNDLPLALLLVVQARADRLRWGLDSGSALALEIRVRRLLSDYQGALDLANGSGEIAATEAELNHPEVLAETAMLQAERGDVEIAKRLMSAAPVAKQPHIAALIAEREGRNEDAAKHLVAAIAATKDLGDQADLALKLTFHGVRSPVIDKVKVDNPAVARELEQMAALFGHQPGALEQFRGLANANYRCALYFYIYLQGEDDGAAAAAWARESAAKWGDPDLWIESARFYGRQKEYSEAISDIHAALLIASDDWGGKRTAYRMLVESHANSGDWKEALTAAASLAADEPDDPSAAWALTICQIHLNDLDGALRSWQQHGAPEPHSESEVGAWIELLGKFGNAVGTSEDALKVSSRFASSESIRRALLGVLFFREKPRVGPEGIEESDAEVDDDLEEDAEKMDPETLAFREMLASYLHDFPNGGIQQVTIDMKDPLASLREQFKDSPGMPELDDQLDRGALPVGFAGEVLGKSYLESLMARDFGPVFAGSTNTEAEDAAIAAAHESGAVIDLSALVTIALLPESIRELISGHFPNVRALAEHQRDAMIGGRSIARDSGLSYRPPRGDIPEGLHRRTAAEIAERTALATEVEESFSRFAAVSHPQLTALPLGEEKFDKPFLLGADLSLVLGVPFWADDTALKEVARGEGGQPFGTPELLTHLRSEGVVDTALVDLAAATLIARGYTGIRFHASVWDLAVSIATSPQGLVNAVRHAGNDDADRRYEAAVRLIDSHVAEPDALEGFVFATGQWLETIAPTEAKAAQNIVTLARELLGKTWMSSSTLPYCVAAFGAIRGRTDATGLLLREIYRVFESIADRDNDEAAATVVFELVSRLDAKDGLRVRAAVLARHFD